MDSQGTAPAIGQRGLADTHRWLVVDLDGTLVRTDTTLECVRSLIGQPLRLVPALVRLVCGRAALKQALATAADLDPAQLPYSGELLAYLHEQRAAGRRLVLATGADAGIATAVALHLGLFDAVLASDGRTNLTGRAKLAAIRDRLNGAPFTYIGDSKKDLAVWCEAASGICVNARPSVVRAAARLTHIERTFTSERGLLPRLLRSLSHRKNRKAGQPN